MTVTTIIDEDRCWALRKKHGLRFARANSWRGVAQRAFLMNLDGTSDDRIDAVMAQPEWTGRYKEKSEAQARHDHNWLIKNGFLPKDTAEVTPVRGQTRALDENEVFRLLDFALNEAKIKGPQRQVKGQTESMALRVVGNWCAIRRDADSPKLKELNPFMSCKAWELHKHLALEEWVKGENTENDHWETLDHLWAWMVRDSPNNKDLLARIEKWPIVTVTKGEHDDLKKWKDYGPVERYRKAHVEVGRGDGDSWDSWDVSP